MQLTNLILVARQMGAKSLLLLRKIEPKLFRWSVYDGEKETETDVHAEEAAEAIRLGVAYWRGFTPLPCGYVFTLPERDEHGNNALFSQMVKSLESPSGIYFDEDLGHNCIVKEIPSETRRLYQTLKSFASAKAL